MCGRLKVLIALTNNWNYNDLQTDWKCSYTNWSSSASQCDDFFSDRGAIQMYKDHVRTFLGRVNSINGRTYSQDETIFGAAFGRTQRCLAYAPLALHTIKWTSACLAMMRAAHLCGDHCRAWTAGSWTLDPSERINIILPQTSFWHNGHWCRVLSFSHFINIPS